MQALGCQKNLLRVIRGWQACQREGLSYGEVRLLLGRPGELLGKPGKLLGKLWIALKIYSERSAGEVARELLRKFGILGSPSFQKVRGSLTPSQGHTKMSAKVDYIGLGQESSLLIF